MHDPDPIPISAPQHWVCCPRQCGLIHLEQAFDDNLHTLCGNAVHARVDKPGVDTARSVRTERAALSKLRALAPREPVQRNELVAPQDIPHIEAEVASGGGQKSVQFHRLKQ